MPNRTIEDMIYQRADEERARSDGVSFAPLYAFMATIAHMARMDERQTILDSLPKAREQGKPENWNAGYDAAVIANHPRGGGAGAYALGSLSIPTTPLETFACTEHN